VQSSEVKYSRGEKRRAKGTREEETRGQERIEDNMNEVGRGLPDLTASQTGHGKISSRPSRT
jgi:hypothetical protein